MSSVKNYGERRVKKMQERVFRTPFGGIPADKKLRSSKESTTVFERKTFSGHDGNDSCLTVLSLKVDDEPNFLAPNMISPC